MLFTAAQFIISWSHLDRIRSEAAFASLAGVAPIPASGGNTVRHRLNRTSDRQLNRALHTVALSRLQHHEETQAYAARRTSEEKQPRNQTLPQTRHRPRGLPPAPSPRQVRQPGPKRCLTNHKSILAIGLGIRACQAGHRTLFATASQWVDRLAEAHNTGRLQAELTRYPLLVIDEVGLHPVRTRSGEPVFPARQLTLRTRLLIVTSNKPFGRWAKCSVTSSSPPP